MLDEEAKALEEVAKAIGKTADVLDRGGRFLDNVFGDSLREFGGGLGDWARYFRYRNLMFVLDLAGRLYARRKAEGKWTPLPPTYVLPYIEGASMESDEDLQHMWAALLVNATDPSRKVGMRKVFIEILRSIEPLDARILEVLAEPGLDKRYGIYTEARLNADEVANILEADEADVKIGLQNLARYSCVIDSWQDSIENLDRGYGGFRVNNPQSNFRLSDLGRRLVDAVSQE